MNEEVSRYEVFYLMSDERVKNIIKEWKDMDNHLVVTLKSKGVVIGSETIKRLLLKSIANGYEAELSLYLDGKEYMIIYGDCCSFQRCGNKDGSGSSEYVFSSLDELYSTTDWQYYFRERLG